MNNLIIAIGLSIFLLPSCTNQQNSATEDENYPNEMEAPTATDSSSPPEIDSSFPTTPNTDRTESNRNPLTFQKLEASGNEPAWSLDANRSGANIQYDLTLDYGRVNLSGEDAELQTETGSLILNTEKGRIIVRLIREDCKDVTGESHDFSVSFSHNEKDYIGCGDFSAG